MRLRKKWWQVSVFFYSWKVQIFYYLAVLGIVFAVPVVRRTQWIPLEINDKFYWSIFYIALIIFCAWRFTVGAKKEYEEKKLG